MLRTTTRALVLIAAGFSIHGSPIQANGAPVVTLHIPLDGLVRDGDRLEVRIEISDPDGDPLTIRAVDAPLGFVFAPRIQVPSPFSHRVDWHVTEVLNAEGAVTITASDGSAQTTVSAPYQVLKGTTPSDRIHIGDVTGDGVDDIVAQSQVGAYPTNDGPFGGVFVWRGGNGPVNAAPSISLHPASNGSPAELVGLRDVTGDGIDDIVLLLRGAPFPIQIWRGGGDLATGMPPTSSVEALDPINGRANVLDERLVLGDVTGDGIDDLIGLAADNSYYVWAGGPTIDPNPTARLFEPVGRSNGSNSLGTQQTVLVDVTGDGLLDLLASGGGSSIGGRNSGQVFLWHGEPGLSGQRAPSAVLTQPWGSPDLQGGGSRFGFQVGDVNGDGTSDVFDLATGDLYVWLGGPALFGRRTAELWMRDLPETSASVSLLELDGDGRPDFLSSGSYTRSFWSDIATKSGLLEPDGSIAVPPDQGFTPRTPTHHQADLDGDGQIDLLALDPAAEHPVSGIGNAGAIHVWYGGTSFGPDTPPDATLVSADPMQFDDLGQTVNVGEVTGDAFLDIVASTRLSVHVWEGGPTRFSGVVESIAELDGTGANVRLADVTGDGAAEILAYENTFLGTFYTFQGGPGLIGTPAPAIAVVEDPAEFYSFIEPGIADLDGDDVLDLYVGSPFLTVAEQDRAGAIDVWRGGTLSAAPDVRIRRAVPVTQDALGLNLPTALRDITGDGRVDLVFGGRDIDVGGVANVGALRFLSGFGMPVELFVPGAAQGARLGGS